MEDDGIDESMRYQISANNLYKKIVKFQIQITDQIKTKGNCPLAPKNRSQITIFKFYLNFQLHPMRNQLNNYLIMEQHDNDIHNNHYEDEEHFTSFVTKSNSNKTRSQSRKNQNQQLQDLLETQTINYGNLSHLSAQKKRLFPDLSFLSKDCTQDHSSYEGYTQMINKIHFERSRTRELNQQLAQIKQQLIKKYLGELMEELNQLSDQNKRLRQVYKKQAGGGYRQKAQQRNNSNKHQEQGNPINENNYHPETPKPRNSMKTGRKSVNGGSVAGSQQPFGSSKFNTTRQNVIKQKSFFGVGNQNFCQTPRIQAMMAKPNKMQYCQSSIDIHAGQSLVPSPRGHKRRQSQLTERKDYPGKQNLRNDFLMSLDDGSELSIENQITGRMSQPGKMPKQRYAKQVEERFNMKDSGNWGMSKCGRSNFGDTVERKSLRVQTLRNDSSLTFPQTSKNIFLQFLQTLLVQERASYAEMADDINQVTIEAEQNFVVPSYNANMKPIEKLEKQIITKNFKLRQLQQVINVYKAEIEQIMGIDIRLIDQLMHELLQVKGKFIEMQQKVNGITGLRIEVETKQKLKEDILAEIKQKMQKRKQQNQQKQEASKQSEYIEPFPIPESLKTLFDFLNIIMPKNSKPIDYLNEVKQLPNNKELFQVFDQKKRASCNVKIKEVIDQIREGRKKFNEVIKIYESRIVKLQEKIQKYKGEKGQRDSQKK